MLQNVFGTITNGYFTPDTAEKSISELNNDADIGITFDADFVYSLGFMAYQPMSVI